MGSVQSAKLCHMDHPRVIVLCEAVLLTLSFALGFASPALLETACGAKDSVIASPEYSLPERYDL
jgi:hypothetical protein